MTTSDDGGRSSSDDLTPDAGADWMRVARRFYDPDLDEELTTAITFAVAAASDRPPSEMALPPLYDCVDVSALEQTLFGAGQHSRETVGIVEFRYTDYLVTVSSEGWVTVYEPTGVGDRP
ncbi:HalOD1 output domain-containing protein [Halomarina rubra]|uniref:HalOD1 output domain-containing protein n=1 Tax=Halomarina rubra TaxID=2071873 RepID=A0ABD6AXK8_9EURY|nr:HalOD1 output domain-containing protein [Halomarina rubra]